jgi:GNAT superfamily N-acetyltransferase
LSLSPPGSPPTGEPPQRRPAVAVAPIARRDMWPTARMLGRAFVDDPITVAIGPRRRAHRRLAAPLSFMGILIASARHGAEIRVARGESGAVRGVSVSFRPGAWPIPGGAAAWEAGWLLVAGPLPLRRGLDFGRRVRDAHLRDPHVYLWFLAVDPPAQASGVGAALLDAVHRDAGELGVPTFLETGTIANVAYYSGRGYRTTGELSLASGEPVWLMERSSTGA